MLNTQRDYPYNEVRKIFETAFDFSINQFIKKSIKPLIERRVIGLKYASTTLPGWTGHAVPLEDLSINNTLIGLLTTNLTAFIVTRDTSVTFQRLIEWAYKTNTDYTIDTINMLIKRVKDLGESSLSSIAYLSYYEAHMYNTQLLEDTTIVLPNEKESALLLSLAKQAAAVLMEQGVCHYRPSLDGGYSKVVSRGNPDFMTDDAVWAVRFRKGGPVTNDTMYLLIAYVMATYANPRTDNKLRYIRVLNPVKNMIYSIDINEVDPLLLRIIRDTIYGVDFANPIISRLTATQQARLIITTVGVLDIDHEDNDAIADHIRQCCPVPEALPHIRHLQTYAIHCFTVIREQGETEERLKTAIQALNHFYYYCDYPDAPMGIRVALDESLLSDLVEKTRAF